MDLKLIPADKVLKSKADLIRKFAFFAMLAFRLKIKVMDSGTMATDGKSIFYNPVWVNDLTLGECIGVFAHELFHCALLHIYRRGGRNSDKWSIACDYAINPILVDDFGFTLPDGALMDRQYYGMSAEVIYSKLKDHELPPPPPWGEMREPDQEGPEGTGAPKGKSLGDLSDKEWKDLRSIQEQEKDWEAAAVDAYESCKSRGLIPGNGMGTVGLGQSQVNWRRQLADCTGTITKTDFSWYPPDPVYIHRKLIVPSLHEPSIGNLVLGIDTSGSVSDKELKLFWSELKELIENVSFQSITVIQCDTELRGEPIVYLPEDELELTVHGRGGTNFRPVFDWIEENMDEEPSALIYFTDMGSSDWPDIEPDYPLFWARTTSDGAAYGKYIDIYLEP
jgi:predicted metal-dependent peptidase